MERVSGLLARLVFVRVMIRLFLIAVISFAAGLGAPAWAGEDSPASIRQIVESASPADSGIREFYRQRGFSPAWSGRDAKILLGVLKHAADEGLDPADYSVPENSDPAAHDIALTRAAIRYVEDARLGRPRLRRVDDDVALPAPAFDAAAGLAQALQTHRLAAFLAEAPPPSPQYAALRMALSEYRAIRDRGGWSQLPPSVAKGLTADNAEAVRKRLIAEDPKLAVDPAEDLPEALKHFQARHGLAEDGRLGPRTYAVLNVTAETRVGQIIANMERWRWLPREFEDNYIAINVPDASLTLVLQKHAVLTSRVVVGKPKTPTPILRAEGAGITVNPPWNVPQSIARKEILPKLKANFRYLKSEDMILLDGPAGDPYGLKVNWRDIPAGTFPYHVQQHPGRNNALGTIKIELPNRFDVYLHDTPAKSAFALSTRDISHGCVRVQRILPLASYALSQNLDAMVRISDAVSTGETRYLPLEKKLPVYFLYWTVFADRDGAIQFRSDIYGRDKRLIDALGKGKPLRLSAISNCERG